MRPLRIEFQAFGPYKKYECVDLDALSSKGLFLISGGTGAGKTTILDAITFALYGKSSGGGRDSFEQMRCKNAADDTETFVKLEFENNGQYYRFERYLEKKRVNLHKSYNAMQKDANGKWQVLFENAKEGDLNKKAAEIIGLEYNQFVQVIILPQGKFEEFLVSSSDEKEKILTSIFGEEMWQIVAQRVFEEANKAKETLTKKRDLINLKLLEDNCESLDELCKLISEKKEAADSLKKAHESGDYSKIIKDNQELLALVKRFEDLEEALNKSKELESKKTDKGNWNKQISDAKRADKVRVLISNLDDAKEKYDARVKAEESAVEIALNAKSEAEENDRAYKEHILLEKDIEEKKSLKVTYEGKKADYEGISAIIKELELAKVLEKKAKEDEEKSISESLKCDEVIVAVTKEYELLQTELQQLIDSRMAGITGEIASKLIEGKECPVCGSTTHPKKAILSESNVTKEQVDEKKNEVDIKYEALKQADTNKTAAEVVVKDKHAKVEETKARVLELSTKHESMKNNLVEGISTLEELVEAIDTLDTQIKNYSDKKLQLEAAAKRASDAYTEANAKVEPAKNETKSAKDIMDKAATNLETGLKEHGFANQDEARELILDEEEVTALTKKVADYEADVKNNADRLCKLNEELRDKEKPDAIVCQNAIDEATKALETYAKESGILETEIKRLEEKEAIISKDSQGLEQKLNDADRDLQIAKKLRGDTGIGLQRYVLGIMFSSVVAEANRMLALFNGGRYRLFRSDDKKAGSKKSGLELKVYDKYSDDKEGRFVESLSGGEKFLTSLALSIGMSSVAKRGGIKIEAMFIDEGFGTLDANCVSDAMNILNSVQKANGIVGIISHMEILQGRIPTKLIAIDEGKGSHLVQTVG